MPAGWLKIVKQLALESFMNERRKFMKREESREAKVDYENNTHLERIVAVKASTVSTTIIYKWLTQRHYLSSVRRIHPW